MGKCQSTSLGFALTPGSMTIFPCCTITRESEVTLLQTDFEIFFLMLQNKYFEINIKKLMLYFWIFWRSLSAYIYAHICIKSILQICIYKYDIYQYM